MFLVRTTFDPPENMDAPDVVALTEAERQQAEHLQRKGVLVHLWRESDTWCAWGVWDVATETDLTNALNELPLLPYMSITVRRIESHPNALAPEATDGGTS